MNCSRTPRTRPRCLIGASSSSPGKTFSWRWIAGSSFTRNYPGSRSSRTSLRGARAGAAKSWMLNHLERTDGLAAIYPAMMNSIFALIALGHGPDDPLTWREIKEFSRFEIEEGDTIRMQPCVSPVWDTCIAMVALEEAGLPADHPALVKAADWMLSKQVLGPGDWQVKNKDAEPGGWAFEFRNDFYPDVDDTAFVLMALQRVKYPDPQRME